MRLCSWSPRRSCCFAATSDRHAPRAGPTCEAEPWAAGLPWTSRGGAPGRRPAVDIASGWSENCLVRNAGFLRWRLGRTLRAAYAVGLLTNDTFLHRIEHLYGASRVDPQELVGDLTFRTHSGRLERVQSRLESMWAWRSRDQDERPQLPLLGLDWTGAAVEMVIGRSSSCDLVLHDPNVSRRHARLFFREGKWIIVDLDSTNGTYINGRRIGRSELLPGDLLALGTERLQVD
jgi:FHA domain